MSDTEACWDDCVFAMFDKKHGYECLKGNRREILPRDGHCPEYGRILYTKEMSFKEPDGKKQICSSLKTIDVDCTSGLFAQGIKASLDSWRAITSNGTAAK